MTGNKLHTLLASFSPVDLRQFGKYLASPFFNENDDLRKLFGILEENLRREADQPVNTQTALSKEKVWQQLFGKAPYEDVLLRRMSSDLTQHALHFLAYQEFTREPLAEQATLLPAVIHPRLQKHFEGILRKIQLQQDKMGLRNAAFHKNMFQVEHARHRYDETTKKITSLDHLELADYHLDCYYITQKLKNYCDALGYQIMVSVGANLQLFPDFLRHLAESDFLREPAIRIYFLIAQSFLHPAEESHFKRLKQELEQEASRFSDTEQINLFNHMINYCIHTKINVGRSDYFTDLFDIYESALHRNVLSEKGVFDPQHYKNIITVGLHIRRFEWVEEFIQTYTPKLPPALQENALTYNLAKVYFHQEKYESVIEQLREVEYKDHVYALGGKLMLLKTYFELDEDMALDSLIDSFRIYLRRNKVISRDIKQQYLNVLRFVKKLATVAPYDRRAVEKISLQIDECKALADKRWIQEKAQELLDNR